MKADINKVLIDILKTKPKVKYNIDNTTIYIFYSDYEVVIKKYYDGYYVCFINGFEQKADKISENTYKAYINYGEYLYTTIDVLKDIRNKKFDNINKE